MTSVEAWRMFIDQPKMNKRASRLKVSMVFPALMEMYEEAHPYKQRPRVIVLDTIRDSWRSGMTYREWAATARQRLRLEFAEDNVSLKMRVIKLDKPAIGQPSLRVQVLISHREEERG